MRSTQLLFISLPYFSVTCIYTHIHTFHIGAANYRNFQDTPEKVEYKQATRQKKKTNEKIQSDIQIHFNDVSAVNDV